MIVNIWRRKSSVYQHFVKWRHREPKVLFGVPHYNEIVLIVARRDIDTSHADVHETSELYSVFLDFMAVLYKIESLRLGPNVLLRYR